MSEKNFKIVLALIVTVLVAGIIFILINFQPKNNPPVINNNLNPLLPMKITSSAFNSNDHLPGKFTCDGIGSNPPLQISDVPENAKSLALVMDDPDAPSGTFVHWVLWNIPPATAEIAEGSLPEKTVVGRNTLGENTFVPPCPPSGTHHYVFKLYALDTILNLSPATDQMALEQMMQNHILAQAELIGLYSR